MLVACIACFTGYILHTFIKSKQFKDAELKIRKIENDAKQIINEAKTEAKVETQQMRQELKEEVARRRKEILENEQFFYRREQLLNEREVLLEQKDYDLLLKSEETKRLQANYLTKTEAIISNLEKIANFSQDEAKQILFKEVENKYVSEITRTLKNRETELKLKNKEIASNIIATAIEKYSTDIVAEKTTSIVKLPNDEMKGRIIGKEGRNIKTFEQLTGVDIIIDDTPKTISISSFNPIRREIALKALNRLIFDGRIQPSRIEEVVETERNEIDTIILENGKQVVEEVNIFDMDIELIRCLGMLKYRTSYGQNVLLHSIEVAKLAAAMAKELELDPKIALRAGLLHDIGKSIDYDQEGSHVTIGVKLATKYQESPIIINAIHSHHGEIPANNVYSVLVSASDTISAARPGARNNTVDDFVERMTLIETLCYQVEGVKKSYAVQSGRQIRIIVDPIESDDLRTYKIAQEIKEKIAENLNIPGDITITVIREFRAVEMIK